MIYRYILKRLSSSHCELRASTVEGFTNQPPTWGQFFVLVGKALEGEGVRWVQTTPVKSIELQTEDVTVFQTLNSVYMVTRVQEGAPLFDESSTLRDESCLSGLMEQAKDQAALLGQPAFWLAVLVAQTLQEHWLRGPGYASKGVTEPAVKDPPAEEPYRYYLCMQDLYMSEEYGGGRAFTAGNVYRGHTVGIWRMMYDDLDDQGTHAIQLEGGAGWRNYFEPYLS